MRPAVVVAMVATLAGIASCGESSADSSSIPAGQYSVTVLTTESELGEVHAFNARGELVTTGPAHGLAIIDTKTRGFTTVSQDGSLLGFDDEGDLLYRTAQGVVMFRHADGRNEPVPLRVTGHGELTPLALANGGAIWGNMYEEHPGELATPGYGAYANGVVTTFRTRTWQGVVDPDKYKLLAANAAGQVVFCKTQDGTEIAGNGFPKVECLIDHPDGTITQLNDVYGGAFRAVPLPKITEHGLLAGEVDVGDRGLGGTRAFLYTPPTGNLLGEDQGEALALNEVGDVIYSQLKTPLRVLLRKANGEKVDLGGFLRHPTYPDRELNYLDILGMNAAGTILVRQRLDDNASNDNVSLLTPL